MGEHPRKVRIRDSTLREGLDTPGVAFSPEQKLRIARVLDEAGVPEIEIVAPSRVLQDLEFVRTVRREIPRLITSGLIYSYSSRARVEIQAASESLHRFDLLMPVSERREPFDRSTKVTLLREILAFALSHHREVGVGFPHSMQTDLQFLLEISQCAAEEGAKRLTIYDTNGSADPFSVYALVERLRSEVEVEIFFHGHNDLGLATANALAAVRAGADGLDVTVNGLGDRAGNASLEQVVLALHLADSPAGVKLRSLKKMSEVVERDSGVLVSKLAPVVGEFILYHKSPSHLKAPDLFEAFDPQILAMERKIDKA
jgi:isopropylmalate/homocitrate/citramalate synthase